MSVDTPTDPPTPAMALRSAAAAKALGMSPRTLWSMTAAGEIPRVRCGRKMVLYPVKELTDWLSARATAEGRKP